MGKGSLDLGNLLYLLNQCLQVVSGYTQSLARVDFDTLTIEPRHLENLDRVLKGFFKKRLHLVEPLVSNI